MYMYMWVCAILCLASAHASVLSAPAEPPLTPENINPRLVAAEYAVRGRLLDRAKELESAGRQTVKCNIGNPQALGQRPLSWVRQVLSLVLNADLLEAAEAAACGSSDGEALRALFPPDAVARARVYVDAISSAGAYSDSQGVLCVREEVAHFLRERDGCGSEARGQSCICTSHPPALPSGSPAQHLCRRRVLRPSPAWAAPAPSHLPHGAHTIVAPVNTLFCESLGVKSA